MDNSEKSFGKNLRKLMLSRNMSYTELAKHLIRMVIDAEYYRCINQDKKE